MAADSSLRPVWGPSGYPMMTNPTKTRRRFTAQQKHEASALLPDPSWLQRKSEAPLIEATLSSSRKRILKSYPLL